MLRVVFPVKYICVTVEITFNLSIKSIQNKSFSFTIMTVWSISDYVQWFVLGHFST